jgi:valyl-tRNA synthetase
VKEGYGKSRANSGGERLEITKEYNPHEVERRWQKRWMELDIYRFRRDDYETPTYVIDTPPPYSP